MDGLHNLSRPKGSHRDRKRVGRGPGSGRGKTAGYGHKGSKARAGHHGPGGGKPTYEGGQMPLQRRLPKLPGFTPRTRVEFATVNLSRIDGAFDAGDEVTPNSLRAKGLIRRGSAPVKVLGQGELSKGLKVSAHAFSASARDKIDASGGTATVLSRRA